MEADAVAPKWDAMAKAFEGTPGEDVPRLVAAHFHFEPTGAAFSEYVEQCLSRAEKTGRSVLLSNCDWRMAFVAELAVQVDNIMAKDLKVKVEDEHNALTKDEVDKFLTHLAGPIIQGLL